MSKFDRDIRGFLRAIKDGPWTVFGVVPKRPFTVWAKQTINRAVDPLMGLYEQYEIKPSDVLNILGLYKIKGLSGDEVDKWVKSRRPPCCGIVARVPRSD